MDKHDIRLAGSCGICMNEAAKMIKEAVIRHDGDIPGQDLRQKIERAMRDDHVPSVKPRSRTQNLDV